MKIILRLFGLGLAALCLVFLTNCAQSSDVATNTDANPATLVAAGVSAKGWNGGRASSDGFPVGDWEPVIYNKQIV